jgi:hypothetical protein
LYFGSQLNGTRLIASQHPIKRTGPLGVDQQVTGRLLKNANLPQNGQRKKILYGKRKCPAWVTRLRSFGVIESISLQRFHSVKRKSLRSLTMLPDPMTIFQYLKCIDSLYSAWTEAQGKCSGRPNAKKPSLMRADT